MKRSRYLALLVLLAIGVANLYTDRGISIAYSPTLDSVCSVIRGDTIKDAWRAELSSKVPEFQSLWGAVGPRLLATSGQITGLQPPATVTAHLTLCNVPSQSFVGISVNMRYALSSFTSSPVPLRYKVDTLFHEILHKVIAGKVPGESRLMRQHSAETECVKNHLHLLALQKATLLALGEKQALQDVVNIDGQLPGGCYRRAWSLVNASDSMYHAFVDEIGK